MGSVRERATLLLGLVVIVAFSAAVGFLAGARYAGGLRKPPGAALAALRTAPSYRLINQLGRRVSSSSFDGQVQVVAFLFPYCTTYCPLIAANLVRLEHQLAQEGIADRVRIVAFNVDPAGSGPSQMRTFQREYGWNPRDTRWQFLTGTPSEIRRVVYGGYLVDYWRESLAQEARDEARERAQGTYVPQPEVVNPLAERAHVGYDVIHNDLLEVVDAHGEIRKIYDEADNVGADQLLAVIRSLVPMGPTSNSTPRRNAWASPVV